MRVTALARAQDQIVAWALTNRKTGGRGKIVWTYPPRGRGERPVYCSALIPDTKFGDVYRHSKATGLGYCKASAALAHAIGGEEACQLDGRGLSVCRAWLEGMGIDVWEVV